MFCKIISSQIKILYIIYISYKHSKILKLLLYEEYVIKILFSIYIFFFLFLLDYLKTNAHTSRDLTGIGSAIIRNVWTANDVNLIYIHRENVPENNSSFHFIQLFDFIDELQKISHCNVIFHFLTLSRFIEEERKKLWKN